MHVEVDRVLCLVFCTDVVNSFHYLFPASAEMYPSGKRSAVMSPRVRRTVSVATSPIRSADLGREQVKRQTQHTAHDSPAGSVHGCGWSDSLSGQCVVSFFVWSVRGLFVVCFFVWSVCGLWVVSFFVWLVRGLWVSYFVWSGTGLWVVSFFVWSGTWSVGGQFLCLVWYVVCLSALHC